MRHSAEVLPKSPRIGLLHEGRPHSKSAEGHGRKDRCPRASALTCVLPAVGHTMLLRGASYDVDRLRTKRT